MKTLDATIEVIEEKIIKKGNVTEEVSIKAADNYSCYKVTPLIMNAIKQVTLSTINIINTESDSVPYYKSHSSQVSGLHEISKISESEDYLLAPSPITINDNKYPIHIGLSLISKTSKPLYQLPTLQFHCQPTLNSDGLPQLNIFIFYDDSSASESTAKFYWENIFEIYFPHDSISGVTLSNIETVQVFQTNADPRTSRGTVTTVKPTNT